MQVKEIDINAGQIKGYGICKKSTKSHFLVVLPLRLTLQYNHQELYFDNRDKLCFTQLSNMRDHEKT